MPGQPMTDEQRAKLAAIQEQKARKLERELEKRFNKRKTEPQLIADKIAMVRRSLENQKSETQEVIKPITTASLSVQAIKIPKLKASGMFKTIDRDFAMSHSNFYFPKSQSKFQNYIGRYMPRHNLIERSLTNVKVAMDYTATKPHKGLPIKQCKKALKTLQSFGSTNPI